MSQDEPAGNTKSAGKSSKKSNENKKKYQKYVWTLTYFPKNEPEKPLEPSVEDFWLMLDLICKKFTFQVEHTKEGKIHYQCALSLKVKEYESTVRNMFAPGHVEEAKDSFACFKYCEKAESRIEGPYTKDIKPLKTIRVLRDWQEKLKNELLGEPDDRKVIWIVDKKGGMGKTSFCKYMAIKHRAQILNNGKTGDIAYAITNPKIVIFNLARSAEERFNYQVLENIKDGLIFSGKYESSMKFFDSPHVVVMSNWEPDLEEMSEDRWDVRYY